MHYLQGHRSVTSIKLSRAVGLPYLNILLINPGYLLTLLLQCSVTLALGLPYLLVNRALISRDFYDFRQRQSLYMSQEAHQARAYPGFFSMKQLGVFLLPPGWDASPSQGYPQH